MPRTMLEAGVRQGVLALGRVAASARDQGADRRVTGVIFRQQHQARTVGQPEAAARDQMDRLSPPRAALLFFQRPYHPGQ